MKKMIIAGFSTFLLTTALYAQNEPEIKIKKISVELDAAPRYTLQKSPSQTDSTLRWLVVQAELDCTPDWADEVMVKFYVVAQYGNVKGDYVPPDKYDVLSATVTVVNMQRNIGTGKKNIVPVFLDSNSVKKYGALNKDQFVPEVAVQVIYKGKVQDLKWMKTDRSGRFWETKSPKGGVLMNLIQSPWWPAYGEFFEQMRTGPPAAAAY